MQPSKTKRSIGLETEQRAVEYIQSHGYEILGRNQNFKVSEIDCIAFDHDKKEIVFFEIRGRRSGASWESALSSLGFQKQRKFRLAIERFIQRHPQLLRFPVRIDFLCWDGSRWQWVKNLFLPLR